MIHQPTLKKCQTSLLDGIKKFGEYSLLDKGADEVLDLTELTDDLAALSGVDAADTLEALMDQDRSDVMEKLVADLVVNLDSQPDDFFEEIVSRKNLSCFY